MLVSNRLKIFKISIFCTFLVLVLTLNGESGNPKGSLFEASYTGNLSLNRERM